MLVDLTDVDFCDSTGLRALLGAASEVRAHGGRFAIVCAPTGGVARLLDVVGACGVDGDPRATPESGLAALTVSPPRRARSDPQVAGARQQAPVGVQQRRRGAVLVALRPCSQPTATIGSPSGIGSSTSACMRASRLGVVGVPQRRHVARAVQRRPRDLRREPARVVRNGLVGDQQRRGHVGMPAQVAEVHAEAVVAARAADVAGVERVAAALREPRMPALRLARLRHGRPHGRLDVGRIGGAALGHEHVAMPEAELAVVACARARARCRAAAASAARRPPGRRRSGRSARRCSPRSRWPEGR